jgi:quinohemoprotein ethanol dehydrogenase
VAAASVALALTGADAVTAAPAKTSQNARMFTDDADGTNWPSFGRTYSEDHHSPLTQINGHNIDRLKLAWFIDLPTMPSAVAPPLAVDGTLYFTEGYNLVFAADAATGKTLWTYDTKTTELTNEKLKVAWGARGLAYADGRIFVGTQDGRLLAISAKSGKLLWSVQTTEGEHDGRYITGPPKVFNGKVIIGHGGADFAPVRGYVTAYDTATGKQIWRFFLVPGDPSKGFENKAMEMAAKTWHGEWWKYGGGGTAWHGITYDPKYNRVYIGTGNGAPWNQNIRSPGGGDNLFLCSIVALDADTGEYIWHYQTTPGESWDYNSVMDIQLATLTIGGKPRDVILHAPKNGFFYVIDRATGKLISAEPFSKVTWAKYVDKTTGRPVENPAARFPSGETTIIPGPGGAHNWYAAAYSPVTKLIYIPVNYAAGYYNARGINAKSWEPIPTPAFNAGFTSLFADNLEAKLGTPSTAPLGELQARDPINQKVVWSVPADAYNDGGTMSTSGNLLFQGTASGKFEARAADTGKLLWTFEAQDGIVSNPISYLAHGKQYVTVVAGYGGSASLNGPASAKFGWSYRTQQRRVLTFAIDGKAALPPKPEMEPEEIVDDGKPIDPEQRKHGRELFNSRCLTCHGAGAYSGGGAPDLRKSHIPTSADAFQDVVRGGALKLNGMPRFDELSPEQTEFVRTYIRGEARRAMDRLRAKPSQ